MEYQGIVDQFTLILPNAGILPFNDLEGASELDEVYERVLPFDLTEHGPMFQNGNWFTGAIKRGRRAEIKVSRTISLDIFCALELPIELLLEIFEFLHPIDLYSVIRSTKRLRGTLLDWGASSVWKKAFNRCSDVLPPCPPDISEPRWASILFGPATCDYCGRKGAMIDFHLRCRLCQFCVDDMYIEKSSVDVLNLLGIVEDLDTFWKCIPPSYRQDQMFLPNVWNYHQEPRYLTSDINRMVARFVFFNSRISSGIPDASLEFEDFKSLEITNVNRGLEESKRTNALMVRMGSQVMEEHKDNMKQLLKHHASILLRRGHNQVDLNIALAELFDRYSYRERFMLNHRSNKLLALKLLRTSEAHKVDRLEKQRRFLIFQRQKITLPPTSWPNLPTVEVVYECEPFAAFIASESKEVGELPEETVQTHLAPFLDSWMQVHERNVLARLESPYENLDLAANVFICASCESEDDCTRRRTSILIGLEDLRAHFKCIDPQCEFRFSFSGRAVALALLDLLGMDPKTATVSILDARDARFFCEGCDVSRKRGVLGCQALTWRECISHVIEMENTNSQHSVTSWALLTAEATECIKRHEQPFPSPECNVWCCNHCPEHYDDATTKANVFRHAKEEHFIDRPRVGVDVIYDRRKFFHLKPRKPTSVGLEPPEIYQCGRCPDTINRLWQLDRLKPHLLDKHQITNPSPGDWRVVRIVERSAGPRSEAIAYPQNVEVEKGGLN